AVPHPGGAVGAGGKRHRAPFIHADAVGATGRKRLRKTALGLGEGRRGERERRDDRGANPSMAPVRHVSRWVAVARKRFGPGWPRGGTGHDLAPAGTPRK